MTDYMKEAERLMRQYTTAVLEQNYEATAFYHSALLAHIQRGAVHVHCTPTEHDGRIVYEHTSEPIPNADGFVLYAAPAPDRFRAAAKMMAEKPRVEAFDVDFLACLGAEVPAPAEPERQIGPASDSDMVVYQSIVDGYARDTAPAPAGVPMPKPVAYGFGNTAITGHTNRLMMVRIDIPGGDQYAGAFWLPLVLADEARQYGAACRAAGEAAGYAKGLEEAGRLVSLWIKDPDVQRMLEFARDASRKVTSWPDRLTGEAEAALRVEVKP
jgi:hypothetical protein